MVAATTLFPGQFIIRHVADLGAGGLGTVDEVEVVASNASHPVGLRLARKRLGPTWANDPGARVRFEREIEMLAQMSHDHIVTLEGVSLPGGERWYAMPLFRNGSLRRALQQGRGFDSLRSIADFGACIANALAHAHALNFIHRDLKPENILLEDNDVPQVADWGLGQFIHKHSKVLDLTRGGMGSHYYCSFEQWSSGRCEASGDVYSLGVVLAELASGHALPISPVGMGIRVDVIAGSTWAAREFNAIIRRMTAMQARVRFQSMTEVMFALQRVAAAC